MLAHFYEYHRNLKKERERVDFKGRPQEFRDVCMDFVPCLKVHSLISVRSPSDGGFLSLFNIKASKWPKCSIST